MDIQLQLNGAVKSTAITITGSKSESNRLLLLQALYPGITISNLSESDDSDAMQKALSGNGEVIDIHHAGTAMRFLTAYYAIQEGKEVVLTGSPRMKERPIGVLVDALRSLGAKIEYAENEGFPPLKITGQKLLKNKVSIKAGVSSQYITALLLIAGKLENGLELTLEGEITSRPYIDMTLSLLNEAGIENYFEGNVITVVPKSEIVGLASKIVVESDWSSASYFYSIAALAGEGTSMRLSSYKKNSLQGDSALAVIYKGLGVDTVFEGNSILLSKASASKSIDLDLNDTPDIAQTIAVTCFGLGIACSLRGLHTLKIKETDRLEALKTEMKKLGAKIKVTNDSLILEASDVINSNIAIATYNDHRMAMAFAPLAIRVPICIQDADVVSKSYPAFWDDLQVLGFTVNRH
ncbi:3-phosphoshikimate 1-carboxyvinyltransferase [Flavobacterium cerinum]|uniref:3-phosphoshikimate 1-carboxyvinyltransferase n=1 Tax=Flavobacterium cerinum TaxID=2502784 RepID=A0A444HFS6_9FLAO|nr:3-phosphoshikimate 1-carboxyvinyltransferase [Flavobacterium cerinum]RWX03723.1 3-phosphoshikimate 1-carboxyvinyltransferase [Flavobacterium cerinum]